MSSIELGLKEYLYLSILALIATHFTRVIWHRALRDKAEPPLYIGWLPFLGAGLEYMKDPYALLLRLQRKHGDLFTVYIAGNYMTYVCDPITGVSQFYSNSRKLSFDGFAKYAGTNIFGINNSVLYDHEKSKELHQTLTRYLLNNTAVLDLMEGFSVHLSNELRDIAHHTINPQNDWVEVDLWTLLRAAVYNASGRAMIGEEFPTDNFTDWDMFESQSTELIKYPKWMLKQVVNARSRVWERLGSITSMKSASTLIRERSRLLSEMGLSNAQTAPYIMAIQFALMANAIPSAFWMTATAINRPELKEAMLKELQVYYKGDPKVKTYDISKEFDLLGICDNALIKSCYVETLRLRGTVLSSRQADEDTLLAVGPEKRQYLIKKGGIAFIPSKILHMDPEVYQNPEQFDPNRFLGIPVDFATVRNSDAVPIPKDINRKKFYKGGVPLRNAPLMPFGGGVSMCSGRYFARGEVIGWTTAFLYNFEVQPVTTSLPKSYEPRTFGLGFERPQSPYIVKIRRRE